MSLRGVLADRPLVCFGIGAMVAAVPFWVAGAHRWRLPEPFSALPVSALSFVVPAGAALLIAGCEGTIGSMLGRLRPTRGNPSAPSNPPTRSSPLWWAAAACAFSVPTVLDAVARHGCWPHFGVLALAGQAVVYVVAALGEELGWTSFALPRLLAAGCSVPAAAALSSTYWVVWHVVPFTQTGQAWSWVLGQSVQAVLMRCTIVGLSAGSGDMGLLAVLLHAMCNLAWAISPPGYRPWVVDSLTVPVAAAAVIVGTRRRRMLR